MSSNNKIGAKCLTNLHLKLSDKGIMEEASIEDEEEEDSNEEKDEEKEKEKEKKDQKAAEEEQETVPTTTHDEAEVGSQGAQEVVQERGEQGEALSEGEASKEEKGEEPDDDDSSSDEEVRMLVKKKPIVTPRKSSRLASKRKCPVVSLDDDSSSHTTLEPLPTAPSSPKPATPLNHHIPSPPPSPIPSTPLQPTNTPASPLPRTWPGLGFADFSNPSSVPVAILDPVLNKLQDLQS